MKKLYVTAASWRGCVRNNNEDMILVGSSFIRNDDFKTTMELSESRRAMIAVADGMGGHNSGEVASSEALHNLQFFFSDIPSGLSADGINQMMADWLESINNIICETCYLSEQCSGSICIRNKTEVQNLRNAMLKAVQGSNNTGRE